MTASRGHDGVGNALRCQGYSGTWEELGWLIIREAGNEGREKLLVGRETTLILTILDLNCRPLALQMHHSWLGG